MTAARRPENYFVCFMYDHETSMSDVHAYYTRDYVYDPSVYDNTSGKYGSSIEGFNVKNLNPINWFKTLGKWIKYALSAVCAVCILLIVAMLFMRR